MKPTPSTSTEDEMIELAVESRRRYTHDETRAWNERLVGCTAEEILGQAIETFGDRLVIASSFGAEDVVLIDLAVRIAPDVRIFTLDTGRLHQETYDVMDRIQKRYGARLEVLTPQQVQLQDLIERKGPNSFYASIENRKECCEIRKVEPLRRALSTADAWVTGLRRAQSVTRVDIPTVSVDFANEGIVKFNPLVDWTHDDIWAHIHERDVPYNTLHDTGFPSIGCAPCTRATQPGEDIRAGRWWWEAPESKECGLHTR